MSQDVYEALAAALDELPNGFPRTPSNVEIALLQKIFSQDEAWLAGRLTGAFEPVASIAARVGLPPEVAGQKLGDMARRGLVWYHRHKETSMFRLAPFIVGIYEGHVGEMDHDFAHLMEAYLLDGGAAGIMQPQPALHRVAPAQSAIHEEWILPYDDVRAILLQSKSFRVRDCICRKQQDLLESRNCEFPVHVCLNFSEHDRPSSDVDEEISQEEALALLQWTEQVGLVHTVSNVMKGIGYVCNCCGCCCGILRGVTEWGMENAVAHANYYAVIDPLECQACGACVERCQVGAITDETGISVVDLERCIGCGLCVTGCDYEVAELVRRPAEEIVDPPQHYGLWEQARLANRQRVAAD